MGLLSCHWLVRQTHKFLSIVCPEQLGVRPVSLVIMTPNNIFLSMTINDQHHLTMLLLFSSLGNDKLAQLIIEL